MTGATILTKQARDQIRRELGSELKNRDTDAIALSLGRHVMPREVRTDDRVEALVANIATIVFDDDPYRIIDTDVETGRQLMSAIYIDELRDRLAREGANI